MKLKVFYGWWLLAGLFIIYSITNGVILNTLPLFYPQLRAEFNWSQAEIVGPAGILFLVVAITSPFIGVLLDRYNASKLMLIGAVLMLLAFLWFGFMNSLQEMRGVYLLFSIGITAGGIIPSMRIITRWFVRHRGIAVGVLLVGSSAGGAIFNGMAGTFMESYGWRTAIMILGILAFFLILLPLVFIIRDSPEELGLHPDGEVPQSNEVDKKEAFKSMSLSITLSEVLRTPTFYLLLLITGGMWFAIVGTIQHQALFFQDLDTTIQAKDVISLFFLCSILGKLIFGWLSDRYSKKTIMFAAIVNLALGALLLIAIPTKPDPLLWYYAVVFGIGFSGTFTMIQLLVAEFYSGTSYGKILGVVTMVDTGAGVLGIWTLGLIRTNSGSYEGAFYLMLGITILAALCVPLLRKPIRHD